MSVANLVVDLRRGRESVSKISKKKKEKIKDQTYDIIKV